MKRLINRINLLLIGLFISELIYPQEFTSITELSNFSLYNTKAMYVTSEIVSDSFFVLISVPDSYSSGNSKYPVLYVLDGDIAFGMAASISTYLRIGNNIPELIVVGIGYGSHTKSISEKRQRDYGPKKEDGAGIFLKFLYEELIPYIDTNFKTIQGERTFSGYSLGGLFGLFTLFTRPESFNNYVIGSPNLSWDDYSIFKYEENSSDRIGNLKLNVFISVGSEVSEESFFKPIDSLVTKIQQKNYSGVNLEAKVFNGSNLLVGPPESLSHGLISVFKKEGE